MLAAVRVGAVLAVQVARNGKGWRGSWGTNDVLVELARAA